MVNDCKMSVVANDYGKINLSKSGFNGILRDYTLKFNEKEMNIDLVLNESLELIQQLFQMLQHPNKRIKARLIANVSYYHVDGVNKIIEERTYHFPSYSAEEVYDVEEFFVRHMQKIISKMDSFHINGSNLVINQIQHIHIPISFIN